MEMASSCESCRVDESKKKRTDLSFEKKAEILEKLKRGDSAQCIAEEYNIGRRTVYNIKSREKSIINTLRSPKENSRKRLAASKTNKNHNVNSTTRPEPGSLVEVIPRKVTKKATMGGEYNHPIYKAKVSA